MNFTKAEYKLWL